MIFNFLKLRAQSFVYAWNGIKILLEKEKNARIHLCFTIAVIIAGFIFRVSAFEWIMLCLTIAAVWTAEAFNTAVERTVDLVTAEKKPLAKEAKDLAAGAVLIFAAASVVVGLIIFLPKILSLLNVLISE